MYQPHPHSESQSPRNRHKEMAKPITCSMNPEDILLKLNGHLTDEGVKELVGRLQHIDCTNYLVLLVYLYTRRNYEHLGKFLLNKCSESITQYEIINWAYKAYTYRERKKDQERVNVVDQKIEEAMVNSVDQTNMLGYLDKESRSNYVDSIETFVNCLTQLSLNLKSIPNPERNTFLKRNLIKGNRALECLRRHNQNIVYCQGILLPFRGNSQLVVRIIDSEASSFNTKKRVPYKIVVETIDIKELQTNTPLYAFNLSKQLSLDTQAFLDHDLKFQQQHNVLENFLSAHKDELAKQQLIHQGKKRFDAQFPITKLNRRNSCTNRIEFVEQLQLQLSKFERKRRVSSTDREVEKSVFFQNLLQQYPTKQGIIEKIQHTLKVPQAQAIIIQEQAVIGPFNEQWSDKEAAIRRASPYEHFESYQLRPLLIKGGDDLRQELMVMQLLEQAKIILEQCGLFIKTYEIMVTSEDSGILEFCTDTVSLDQLKKSMPNMRLTQIYRMLFAESFEEAQKCFIDSLAAYSLVQYLFQIKDRHNGNILLDNKGHLIHIDFGFVLCMGPGGMNFEQAPFKLTKEYIELMDGKDSDMFNYFKNAMFMGYCQLSKHLNKFLLIIDVMRQESELSCFDKFDIRIFKDRFMEQADEIQIQEHVYKIVNQSAENTRTVLYDNFQKITNGIQP